MMLKVDAGAHPRAARKSALEWANSIHFPEIAAWGELRGLSKSAAHYGDGREESRLYERR